VLVLLGVDEASAGLSFRNLPRITVMPVDEAGVADVIGAASLLVSETALPSLVTRAGRVTTKSDLTHPTPTTGEA
jgi:large subunit ribosomal protein L4